MIATKKTKEKKSDYLTRAERFAEAVAETCQRRDWRRYCFNKSTDRSTETQRCWRLISTIGQFAPFFFFVFFSIPFLSLSLSFFLSLFLDFHSRIFLQSCRYSPSPEFPIHHFWRTITIRTIQNFFVLFFWHVCVCAVQLNSNRIFTLQFHSSEPYRENESNRYHIDALTLRKFRFPAHAGWLKLMWWISVPFQTLWDYNPGKFDQNWIE